VTVTLEHVEQEPDQLTPPPYSKKLLFGGTLGRIWLWFVAGCIAIVVVSLPPLRWFALLSLAMACVYAVTMVGWRKAH